VGEVKKKFSQFVKLLEERTVNAIENSDINKSCTATLLLLFAAIDSLSKITCNDLDYESYKKNKGVENRFNCFLDDHMRNKYSIYKNNIYKLRNDIVHTGVNAKVILSKESDYVKHLEVDNQGNLWINTFQFLKDLKKAIDQIKKNIDGQGNFYQNAQNRIKDFKIIKIDENSNIPSPSPGPDEELFVK
jgi:hypothetical protein